MNELINVYGFGENMVTIFRERIDYIRVFSGIIHAGKKKKMQRREESTHDFSTK